MHCTSLIFCFLLGIFNSLVQVKAFSGYVILTHDGPCVKGGRITFRADLYEYDGSRPSGTFYYKWGDNGLYPHEYESESTTNTTFYYVADFPPEQYPIGIYEMQVIVGMKEFFIWHDITSRRKDFEITTFLNGNMSISQGNSSLTTNYVASGIDTRVNVQFREGDEFYLKNNSTGTLTYWFVDCKYYGMTSDFGFNYTFPKADETYVIEALVIASHESPTTTTLAPTTTTTSTTTPASVPSVNVTTTTNSTSNTTSGTTLKLTENITIPLGISTTTMPSTTVFQKGELFGNETFPFVCLNSSIKAPDPKKTYGYFYRKIEAKAPIKNITVEGTNWIQPWEMLSLKVSCLGSGPFAKCLKFHRGEYNVTGNESCEDAGINLPTCNFSILHYFLEPSLYTIVVIMDNKVSKQIYPVTIHIYKASTQPQLSVIVVPVSCSLAAIVLIIFGVAYYIQSRARFTVEVADFDFGQNNPELEYKTFTERLRDAFNNSGYKQLNNPGSSMAVGN